MDDETALLDWYHIQNADSQSTSRRKQGRRWKRREKIGEGAFGLVFLEEDESTGQLRAVKEVRKRNIFDHRRELIALTRLARPAYEGFFAGFLGWGEDTATVFIYMEFFQYGDLGQYIEHPLIEEECRDIVLQLLSGLVIMHADGITHRDLKPQNIFVLRQRPSWRVKIGDFGVSKRVCADETNLGTTVGSKFYMAPEVAGYVEAEGLNNAYNSRVDVWSVGIVAFKLLTCKVPFDPIGQLIKFCDDRVGFPDLDLINRGTSGHGIAFIQYLLQPHSSRRPDAETALDHVWFDTGEGNESLKTLGSVQSGQHESLLDIGSSSPRSLDTDQTPSQVESQPRPGKDAVYLFDGEETVTILSREPWPNISMELGPDHQKSNSNRLGAPTISLSPEEAETRCITSSERFQGGTMGQNDEKDLDGEGEAQQRATKLDVQDETPVVTKAKAHDLQCIVSSDSEVVERSRPLKDLVMPAKDTVSHRQSTLNEHGTGFVYYVKKSNLKCFNMSLWQSLTLSSRVVAVFDCLTSKIKGATVPRLVSDLVQHLKRTAWPSETVSLNESWMNPVDRDVRSQTIDSYLKEGPPYRFTSPFNVDGFGDARLTSSADLAYMLLEYLSRIPPDLRSSNLSQLWAYKHQDPVPVHVLWENLDEYFRDLLSFLFDFINYLEYRWLRSGQVCKGEIFQNLSFIDRFATLPKRRETIEELFAFYCSRLSSINSMRVVRAGLTVPGARAPEPLRSFLKKSSIGDDADSKASALPDRISIPPRINTSAETSASSSAAIQTQPHNRQPEWAYSLISPSGSITERISVTLYAGYHHHLHARLRNDGSQVWNSATLQLALGHVLYCHQTRTGQVRKNWYHRAYRNRESCASGSMTRFDIIIGASERIGKYVSNLRLLGPDSKPIRNGIALMIEVREPDLLLRLKGSGTLVSSFPILYR